MSRVNWFSQREEEKVLANLWFCTYDCLEVRCGVGWSLWCSVPTGWGWSLFALAQGLGSSGKQPVTQLMTQCQGTITHSQVSSWDPVDLRPGRRAGQPHQEAKEGTGFVKRSSVFSSLNTRLKKSSAVPVMPSSKHWPGPEQRDCQFKNTVPPN